MNVSNVLSEEKQSQVIALGRLGWSLRRIQNKTGVRRETAAGYLKAAGIAVRPPGAWGKRAPESKPANEVFTDSGGNQPPKPANAVFTDPGGEQTANPANEVITGSGSPVRPGATWSSRPLRWGAMQCRCGSNSSVSMSVNVQNALVSVRPRSWAQSRFGLCVWTG